MAKLTARDVMNVGFHKANIGGYRSDEVDIFIDKVQETFEEQDREIESLKKKLVVLAKRIEQYREEEDNVKTALLSAQKLADVAMKDAQKKAEDMINEAQAKVSSLEQQSRDMIESKKDEIVMLQTEAAKFKAELIDVYKKHLVNIKAIPEQEESDLNSDLDQIKSEADKSKKKDKEAAKKVEFDDKAKHEIKSDDEKSDFREDEFIQNTKDESDVTENKTKKLSESVDVLKNADAEPLDDDLIDSRETRTFKALKFGEDYNVEDDEIFDDIDLPNSEL